MIQFVKLIKKENKDIKVYKITFKLYYIWEKSMAFLYVISNWLTPLFILGYKHQ